MDLSLTAMLRTTLTWSMASACVGFLLLGCGGNDSSRNTLTTTDNPYEGSYSGTYATSNGLSDSGTVSLDISGNGKIEGTATSTTNGASGAFLGSVSDDGTLAATITLQGQTTLQLGGPVTKATDNSVNGSLLARMGSTTGNLTLSLTRNLQ